MNDKPLSAKEYLSQAYRIDLRINSKLEQIANLRLQAHRVTPMLSDVQVKRSRDVHSTEMAVAKLIDMERQINDDIDRLVNLKSEIARVINSVSEPEQKTLLELRYLCFKTWEQVAETMFYSVQNTYKLHNKALDSVAAIRAVEESLCL